MTDDVESFVNLKFNDADPGASAESHITIEALSRWEKPLPAFMLDLSEKNIDLSPVVKNPRWARGKYLTRFKNAHLVWTEGFIKDGEFQTSVAGYSRHSFENIANKPESQAFKVSGFRMHDGVPSVPKKAFDDAERIDGRVLWCNCEEVNNWGLWILHCLPAMVHFVENRSSYDKLFTFSYHPNMRKLMAYVGIKEEDVIFHNAMKTYLFDDVTLFRRTPRDLYVSQEERAVLCNIRESICASRPKVFGDKIFLSRMRRTQEMNAYRGLINEGELISALEKIGFIAIDPEYMQAVEQIAAIGHASAVVGLGGAGMFNAAFCRGGAKVVNIESTDIFLNVHSNIFASCALDYGLIVGKESDKDTRHDHKSWTIDVESTESAIRNFIGT